MANLDDILRFVQGRAQHPLHRDEVIHHGHRRNMIRGATICWMASPGAIRYAGESADDLLICHESLYYPYDVVNSENPPSGWQQWRFNVQRRDLIE